MAAAVVGDMKISPPAGPAGRPTYTMQALWEGKISVKDFAVESKTLSTCHVAHDLFEQEDVLPVIDFAALNSTSAEDKQSRDANIAKMFQAAQTLGFFKIKNHGVPLEVVKKVEGNGKKFFALPMERKLQVYAPDYAFGYTGGSPVHWSQKWWLEGLQIKVQDDAIRKLVETVWPDDKDMAEDFIQDLEQYYGTVRSVARVIVESLTEALGLRPGTFTDLDNENAICSGRITHYPPCPDPTGVFGISDHTDPQMLSVLYQDEVGGLQVLRDEKWVGIRPNEDTFVVNIGDTFQAITNGILKSVRHRVVVNATQPRYSTVYFYGIDNTIPLTVPPELVTEDRPLLYKPFTVNEYRKWIISNAIPLHSYKHLQINPE